jgi:hypothetical protein
MRYETPELVVVGAAQEVVLGETINPEPESLVSTERGALVGYDE